MKEPAARRSQPRGVWIALFGPDGVGKSTVIEELKVQLGASFAAVIQFHFRPMFGRKRADRPVTNPHGQPPRGRFISLIKLIYWLLDCWCGYLFVIRPGLRRAGLVILDRYYPDILVDPLRYRLPPSSHRFARRLVALAPRPDLNVLLEAPIEVIRRRKSEVSVAESQRQQVSYRTMFQSIPDGLIVNTNCPAEQAAQRICAAVRARLSHAEVEQQESPPCKLVTWRN